MSKIDTGPLAYGFQSAYCRAMQLSQYLQEQGITLRQFADQIGVANAGVVQKYVAGRVPRPWIMERITRETGGKVQPGDFYSQPAAQEA